MKGKLSLFERYPKTPGFKGPETSRMAAEAIAPTAAGLRAAVLAEYHKAPAGLTADEVAARLGMDILAIRPRCSELVTMCELERTGLRRPNASGKQATVWRGSRNERSGG
jgi:hypothetical protein